MHQLECLCVGGRAWGEVPGATRGHSPWDYDLEGDDLAFVALNPFFVTYVLTSKTGSDYDGMF